MRHWLYSVFAIRFAACLLAFVLCTTTTNAQPPTCTPYRVSSSFLNVLQEPRENAPFVDMLDAGDIACVGSNRLIGAKQWGHVLFRVIPDQRERMPVDGWAMMQNLAAMRMPHELTGQSPRRAPGTDAQIGSQPQPVVAADGYQDIVRFDQPLPFGPVPINGRTLSELTQSIPLFPPVKEAEEALWQKQCPSCHRWERQSLCKQGEIFLANPRNALRQPHPFGGPFKVALMRWAKNGCQ
jgi:hypothetical protein